MKVRVSATARNRFFAKAMLRIRPSLNHFLEGFSKAVPSSQTCDAILVMITDDRPVDSFEEIHNADGYFQMVFGCPFPNEDSALELEVIERIKRAIENCPLSADERELSVKYIQQWDEKR